ncbi:uncharacterized protein METZ01_LOCUS283037 [marine metagenome]|uniref:Uncharacterized protein n=1 Tax=marine metagenome TaxID=408172 RepID=A0A382L2Z1_9ZZZZ
MPGVRPFDLTVILIESSSVKSDVNSLAGRKYEPPHNRNIKSVAEMQSDRLL